VCYHKEGKVHGYSMVRTEDLASWRDPRGVAFEPQATPTPPPLTHMPPLSLNLNPEP